ncbi:hypothetical protein [Arthrobacter castelli]|uniref:hypothetical protein n=1 Tax=Arthrobacter castelli TaxID=271431 RepID=UPI0012DDF386|nr:hypothetical protein [Arthrobacter castelli]
MAEPRCTVCRHHDRPEIDRQLAGGASNLGTAEKFGMSKDSVRRHRERHLSAALKAVATRRETQGAVKASDRAEELYSKAQRILEAAEEAGQGQLALGAIKELRATVELLAKLSGELDERPQVNVLNVQSSPEWLAIQGRMLEALAPFPDARVAVAGALEDMGEVEA